MLIVFWVIFGLVVGGLMVFVFVYLLEMVLMKICGIFGIMNNLMVVIGILLVYIVNYLFMLFEVWCWMVGLVVVFVVFLLIGIVFMFELLRWFVKCGCEDEVKNIMKIIYG